MDRFPYLLKRWKGPISSVMYLDEKELVKACSFLHKHYKSSITFSLYIVHNRGKHPFFYGRNKREFLKKGLYPYNVMRNIGIDSISTTHYLLTDIDVLPSANLYDSILHQAALLRDPDNVILFQLFQFSSTLVDQCNTLHCTNRL